MEHEEHLQHIIRLSQPNGALAPFGPSATINNPKWFYHFGDDRRPTTARLDLHKALFYEVLSTADYVKKQNRAILMAGPPGAGKSFMRKKVLNGKDHEYLILDADEFKERLLLKSLEDGTYESDIVPPEIKELEANGATFYPLELASLVHEESSRIMKYVRDRVIGRGLNIVIDGVLSDAEKACELTEKLGKAGYSITIINVEVPFEVSQERIRERWLNARKRAEREASQLGGRWVPSNVARGVFEGPAGRSKSEHAAMCAAISCEKVREYHSYRTTTQPGQETKIIPGLEVSFHKEKEIRTKHISLLRTK